MAILQVRDVPEELYKNLSDQAREENRSISQETIFLLKNALKTKSERLNHRKKVLDEIERLDISASDNTLSDPADLIREDRDR